MTVEGITRRLYSVGSRVMARVEYDRADHPNRVILGRRRTSDTIYLVFPVERTDASGYRVRSARFAFRNGLGNRVSVSSLPRGDVEAMERQASLVLAEALGESEQPHEPAEASGGVLPLHDEARSR